MSITIFQYKICQSVYPGLVTSGTKSMPLQCWNFCNLFITPSNSPLLNSLAALSLTLKAGFPARNILPLCHMLIGQSGIKLCGQKQWVKGSWNKSYLPLLTTNGNVYALTPSWNHSWTWDRMCHWALFMVNGWVPTTLDLIQVLKYWPYC